MTFFQKYVFLKDAYLETIYNCIFKQNSTRKNKKYL